MKIPAELQKTLKKLGIYVTEACDNCTRVLGPVRYAKAGAPGVWCSRKCRDGVDAHAPGTCWNCGAPLAGLRRGTRFCSATCRKRENRKSGTAQISRDEQLKTQSLRAGVGVLAVTTQPDLLRRVEAR